MSSVNSFALIPFPSQHVPKVNITGEIERTSSLLSVRYHLRGSLEDILIPARATSPSRKDELWKATCFEFFLALKDQPGYWEFNLAPSGDWNMYHMDDYRRIGFREETSIAELPFDFKMDKDGVSLDVHVNLSTIIQPGQSLQVGITAVIQTKDGDETHWALTHPAPYPDFHLRESFILALTGETDLAQQSAPGDR